MTQIMVTFTVQVPWHQRGRPDRPSLIEWVKRERPRTQDIIIPKRRSPSYRNHFCSHLTRYQRNMNMPANVREYYDNDNDNDNMMIR